MQPGMEVQGSAVSLLSLHMLNTMRRFYASAGAPAGAEKLGTIHPSWGQLRTHPPPKRASRGPGDGARERSSLYHWVVTCQCSMPAKSYLVGDLTSRDLKTAEDLAEKSDSVSPISFPKRRAFGTSDLCYCPKRTCRLGKSFGAKLLTIQGGHSPVLSFPASNLPDRGRHMAEAAPFSFGPARSCPGLRTFADGRRLDIALFPARGIEKLSRGKSPVYRTESQDSPRKPDRRAPNAQGGMAFRPHVDFHAAVVPWLGSPELLVVNVGHES